MALNIGRMRDRVALQSYTETTAANGQKTRSWTTYATVWAFCTPVSAGEPTAGDQMKRIVNWAVEMRWRSTVTSEHRMVFTRSGVTHTVHITGVVDVDNRGDVMQVSGVEELA